MRDNIHFLHSEIHLREDETDLNLTFWMSVKIWVKSLEESLDYLISLTLLEIGLKPQDI